MSSVAEERWQTKITSISEGLRHIYASKEFTDVTIRVRGQNFKAHKLVLASRSSVFARLLMGPRSLDEIIIDRSSPVTVNGMKILLRFIYTNELNTDDKKSIVEGYLSAVFYSQKALENKCLGEIESWELNTEEVCDLLDSGWDVPILKDRCISYVRCNTKNVISSDSFSKVSFKILKALMEAGALEIVPVLKRIDCIMKWGKHHLKIDADYSLIRAKLLNAEPPLLHMLEFEKLNLQELAQIRKRYPFLLTAEEFEKFLLYSISNEAADLPAWCNPQIEKTPGDSKEAVEK